MFETGVAYRNDDSYCGPISMLQKMPGGELLVFREAKWRGRRTHMDPTARTSLLRSRDRGRTWFSHVTPDAGGGNGASIVRLSDGVILVNVFHYDYAPVAEQHRMAGRRVRGEVEWLGLVGAGAGIFVSRSITDGYTWTPPRRVDEPPGWQDVCSHGAILELPDGDLLLPATGRGAAGGQDHSVALRSRDRGLTWGEPVCLTADGPADLSFHETRLLLCPSGRILALHRTPKGNYWQNVSADGGRTWGRTTDTGLWCGASSPPDLRLLADGRALLTRGYRRPPYGVRAYVSDDEGDTWRHETVLRDDGLDRDMGYPSTAQLDDGRLLTVYYWHGEDQVRHLQYTVWDAPG